MVFNSLKSISVSLIGLLLHFMVWSNEADKTAVVANSNSLESIALANYYVQQRGIPTKNLILLDMPDKEVISLSAFVDHIWNPLRDELIERELIEGLIDDRKDLSGRKFYYPISAALKYLVLIKGTPLKIENQILTSSQNLASIDKKFRTTRASVDSELMFVSAEAKPLISWQRNPLFEKKSISESDQSIITAVCRIDATTFSQARAIIDRTLLAEEQPFPRGRAYIDLHSHHPDGDRWLNSASNLIANFGYDVDIQPDNRFWNQNMRHDRPAIYLGWYKQHPFGPAVDGSSTIPPGAIGGHIHSYSAGSILNPKSWVSSIISSGFSVTFGNVYEPYLQLSLRPDRFIEALLVGKNVGEASLYSHPVASWQTIVIGDPLYSPFSKKESLDYIPTHADPYSTLVYVNQIKKIDSNDALDKAISHFITSPSIPLAAKILEDFESKLRADITEALFNYLIQTPSPTSEEISILSHIQQSFSEKHLKNTNRLKERIQELSPGSSGSADSEPSTSVR